jgi:ADP-ribose pyrophosphatase YjhB (NUDIX family)
MKVFCFVLIEKNNNYLLNCETSRRWKGKWFLPGGQMKTNENPVNAMLREFKEETASEVILDGIFYFIFNKGLLADELHIYYYGRTEDYTVKTVPDQHSIGTRWFNYEEINQLPLRQNALQIIDAYRSAKGSLPIYNFHYITD